jgi:rubrerythrin
MELKGSKTEKNLKEAFAGESMARNKYTFFAGKAKKEGFQQIASFFEETASQEKEHAEIWYKLLYGEINTTEENLRLSAGNENEEWTSMYKRMAEDAHAEGFKHIAFLFENVAAIEAQHEKRYLKLLENVKNNTVFIKPEKITWVCRNCGHVFNGTSAPAQCPICSHPQAYFEQKAFNY